MKALASVAMTRERLDWQDCAPIVVRPTGRGQVHLVQAAGGPLGGDELSLDVRVGAAAELRIRSVAATVVQQGPAGEPASWQVSAEVQAGALLDWRPEPTVVCAGADHRSQLRIDLDPAARLLLREQVLLGRVGEPGGRYRGRLTVTVGGKVLLDTETLLDGLDAALSGPAGSGGFRVFGSLLVAGRDLPAVAESADRTPELISAVLPLDGPGYLVLALGMTSSLVSGILSALADRVGSSLTTSCGADGRASTSSASAPGTASRS
jgi:urease accessory protein